FWPFTQVLRKIWPGVTRKVGKTEDVTDGISWLASAAADALQLDARLGALGPATAGRPTCFLSALSLQSLVNPILAQDSRLLFLAEFLESGIGAQRVPDRVEPKKGRRNGAVIGRL